MNRKLFVRDLFEFSIDEIDLYNLDKEIFIANIIPEFNAKYFPPNLLKNIKFQGELLEKEMYFSIMRKYNPDISEDSISTEFLGQVVQGGFYSINGIDLPNGTINFENIYSKENSIFNNTRIESPYKDIVEEKEIQHFDGDLQIVRPKKKKVLSNLYLYCFNVGQGDSLLVITPTGSVYIIDTNYYSRKSVENFIENVKDILTSHGLPSTKIKALIITHKHVDHLRGASILLNKAVFDIEYFLINHDYKHDLKSVKMLLEAAKSIPNWININKPGLFMDGGVKFEIVNPDYDTSSNQVAPDMNDSSISIQILNGDDTIYLTGDTGHEYLYHKFSPHKGNADTVLKVSHHGSRTGTNDKMLSRLNPNYAFISAGNSKKYKHPHKEVVDKLEKRIGKANLDISKSLKFRRLYISTGGGISRTSW
ncbi:hypothetical protein J8TS2_04970 [Lederbergia ruris]|uniref:Metallo-beta-lactamase domain-containing protein n=1 Tax=Lederbergia ruris TaxID=217495 RepID=A0ABQ4KDY0_9BACI|nr:hypothetical protein J8TS2_04970 [Lederbergia ruris]